MIERNTVLSIAAETLRSEGEALITASESIGDSFVSLTEKLMESKGRIIVSGIGKSAQIGQKIVATLNSTGTPAIFMHAADAIHGDLGMIQEEDRVLCLSKSGNTPEIKVLIPLLKARQIPVYAFVSDPGSYLEAQADITVICQIEREACPHNLTPTTSTTLQLALGDALAVTLLKLRGFSSDDFAALHPGGSLGKKLYMRVCDLYINNAKPVVREQDSIRQVILSISSNRLGATAVVNQDGELTGIITDGDLRRMMEHNEDNALLCAGDIMSRSPMTVEAEAPAVRALNTMRENSITQLLVINEDQYVGVIHIHDILKEGIV